MKCFFKASCTLCNLKIDKQYDTKQELYSHELICVTKALLNNVYQVLWANETKLWNVRAEILMWAYLTPLLKNLTRKYTLRNLNLRVIARFQGVNHPPTCLILTNVYKSFNRSNFNNCPLVWHFCNKITTENFSKELYILFLNVKINKKWKLNNDHWDTKDRLVHSKRSSSIFL